MSRVGQDSYKRRGGVLLLAPEIAAPGGIQTYMRQLLAILSEWSVAQGLQVSCVSLVDSLPPSNPPVRVLGCAGRKSMLAVNTFRVASNQRPEVVIVGHLALAPIAWALTRARLSRSYGVLLYGIEAWRKLGRIECHAVRTARVMIAVSRHTAVRFAEANGGHREMIKVIPASVEIRDLAADEVTLDTDRPLRVLTVARLVSADRYKGIDTLLEAVRRVLDGGTMIELTVVGGGDDGPRLRRLASALGLAGRVRFTGVVSDEELNHCYRSCDVFAMPSRMEGLGIVFLEAMRWGKPCIGGNHGGTPEVIDDGVDGFLVEYGDLESLTTTLRRLAKDTVLRSAMGGRALAKIRSKYSFSQMQQAWLSLLSELLASQPVTASIG